LKRGYLNEARARDGAGVAFTPKGGCPLKQTCLALVVACQLLRP